MNPEITLDCARLATSACGDELRDLRQQAFLELLQSGKSLNNPKAISRRVRYRRIDRYRKSLRAKPLNIDPPDYRSNPAELCERAELVSVLRAAIDRLSPLCREVIYRYYCGERLREIAISIGVPYQTVNSRHRRGLEQLANLTAIQQLNEP